MKTLSLQKVSRAEVDEHRAGWEGPKKKKEKKKKPTFSWFPALAQTLMVMMHDLTELMACEL